MAGGFQQVLYTRTFERDAKRLDALQRAALAACIEDLQRDPIPDARRFHRVNDKRPKVYTVDLFTHCTTHKVSLHVDDEDRTRVILRRVGTHKEIDRMP